MIKSLLSSPYIIIGMHRSGTTLLADILMAAEVFMGNDLTNDKESWYFQQINMALMSKNGFDWATPGVPVNTTGIEYRPTEMIRHYGAARRYPGQLIKLLSGGSWGWKDPRNTFTLNYWLKIFPNAKVIHIYRNGMDAALSLYSRNNRIGESGKENNKWYEPALENKNANLDLWEKYTAQAFSYQNSLSKQMLTLQFEKLVAGDILEIKKLETFTHLSLRAVILKLVDKERTGRYHSNEHKELVEYAKQNQWMKKLGYV